ncbi:DUF4062 domain-containing protein [Aliarcobacter butzleri]|uniref:DUF4062 domain-containing protein n=1 Tax=Aliarcobacter butzleri TaxID=28197 RepID=UPI0021B1B08A|nr:DUF4062 domain-containing protein [Aliarcobacter butzleri]MCT7638229.1 DUF4062 domain-containing protein [Aliarcobacter butzleri]
MEKIGKNILNRTFRLFVSSTFSDFKKERDVLHKRVFPKIEEFCNENGFSFQPIDLRWGVSSEAQHDQKTLEVCLEEVRACKHFPYPNFLIMVGDRYGYIPLPYMIVKNELDSLKNIILGNNEKFTINYKPIENNNKVILKNPKNITKLELIDEWYKLDENQIPVSYILQPRESEYKEYSNWEEEEKYLRNILQNAANILFKDKKDKEYLKYFTSATESEVLEGIIDYKKITNTQEKLLKNRIVENADLDKKYVYAYKREIKHPSKDYIDFTENEEEKEFLKQKAMDFKNNLSDTLYKDNILSSNYDSINLYEKNELKEFENFIYEKLIEAINTQKDKSNELSILQKEILEQEKFKNNKQKGFIGREWTLNIINKYLFNDKTNEPLVIYGISGMGKSALIAKAIDNIFKTKKIKLIYRFVGATQNSTNIKNLLISICDELANKNIIEDIKEYEIEEDKFFKQINEILTNIEKSIVIFIDALDQLQFKDCLEWLPKKLNENIKIVFSVLKDEKYKEDSYYYNILRNRVNINNLIDIANDSLESSKELIIKNLLLDLNRKIDDYQTKYLIDQWNKTNYSPLYLKIAIEEVKQWKSGDKTQTLNSTVEGIIKEYIENLTEIYHHEKIIVNKVFGYIHASKDGLCEKELLEILSEDLHDNKVMKNLVLNKFHEPIKVINPRRKNNEENILPMSIWSRLHTQIKPFIIERNIDNKPLMKFFHRQFTSVVDDLTKNNQIKLHTKLSQYFYTMQDKTKTWNKRYYSLRMLSELPYQLYKSEISKQLKEILFDLEFAGSVYDNNKQDSFKSILKEAIKLKDITEDEIYPWESFYREKEYLIVKVDEELWRPHQTLFQLAYEDGIDSPLTKKADIILKNNKVDWYWLKNILKKDHYYRNGLSEWYEIKENEEIYQNYIEIKNIIFLENGDLIITIKNNVYDYVEKYGFFYIDRLNNRKYFKNREDIKMYKNNILKRNYFYSKEDIYNTHNFNIHINDNKIIIYDKIKNKTKCTYIDGFSITGFKILSDSSLLVTFDKLSIGIFDIHSINEIVTRKDHYELNKTYKFMNLILTIQNQDLILFDLKKEKIIYEYNINKYNIESFAFINHSLIIFWTIDSIYLLNINSNELKLIYNLEVSIGDCITVKENNKLFWLENNNLLYLNIVDFKFKEISVDIDKIYLSEKVQDDGSLSYQNGIKISDNEFVKWDISHGYYKYIFNNVSYDFNVEHGDPKYDKLTKIEFKTGEVITIDENSNHIVVSSNSLKNYNNVEIDYINFEFEDFDISYRRNKQNKQFIDFFYNDKKYSRDIKIIGKIFNKNEVLYWSTSNASCLKYLYDTNINIKEDFKIKIFGSNKKEVEAKLIEIKFNNKQYLYSNNGFNKNKFYQLLNTNFFLKPEIEIKEDIIFLYIKDKAFPYKLFFGNSDISSNNIIINEIIKHNSKIRGHFPSTTYKNQKFNLVNNF